MAKLFRFAELFVALLLLFWFFTRLPLAIEISGDYLRKLSGFIASPLFVFILCQVIVVSIMVNSGRFSRHQNQSLNDSESELMVKNSSSEDEVTKEIVFEDKQVISEMNTTIAPSIKAEHEANSESEFSDPDSDIPRVLRRWQSENFKRECFNDGDDQLRRSESEKCLDIVVSGHERHSFENSNSHDKLSDDDFNRKVEAFIAKQLKFRRQEHGSRTVELRYRDFGYEKSEVSRFCASHARVTTING